MDAHKAEVLGGNSACIPFKAQSLHNGIIIRFFSAHLQLSDVTLVCRGTALRTVANVSLTHLHISLVRARVSRLLSAQRYRRRQTSRAWYRLAGDATLLTAPALAHVPT